LQNWLNVVFLKPFLVHGPPLSLIYLRGSPHPPPFIDAVTYEEKVLISTLFICVTENIYIILNYNIIFVYLYT